MENNTLSLQPDNSSQMSIASLRYFTFSFKASGLINRRVNTTISNDFFVGWEVFNISNFSEEMDSRGLAYSFNGEEEVEIFREGSIFRKKVKEDTGKFFKFILEEEELLNFFREDNFFVREMGSDRIFSEGEDFRRGKGIFSTFRGGVEEEAFKFFRREEREEVNVVGAGGFTGKEDGFFREGGNFFDEGFKAEVADGEFLLKEDVLGIFKGTDRERMFRDIKAYKNFKTHRSTSNIKYFEEAGHCQPILHVDKGLVAQPTYNGLWQGKANSYEGSRSPGEMELSCSFLCK